MMNEPEGNSSTASEPSPPAESLEEDSELSRIIGRLKTLPSYHPTVVSLLTISTESPTAVEEFESVFRNDPAFAGELLQVANSPEFGFPRRIESIRHSLVLLGLERVSSVAFSLSMRFYMNRVPTMRDVQAIWAHSVATAVVARAMADAWGIRNTGVYTAGLVHDIGRLGLLTAESQKYLHLAARPFDGIDEYLAAEAKWLGVAHTVGGAAMAQSWGLPESLCDCIKEHHDAPASSPVDNRMLVAGACRLAAAFGYEEFRPQQPEHPEEILTSFPASVRGHSLLQPDRLQQSIKSALKGVWA